MRLFIFLFASIDLNVAHISFTGSKNGDFEELLYTNANVLMRQKDDEENVAGIFGYFFSHEKSKYKEKFIYGGPLREWAQLR